MAVRDDVCGGEQGFMDSGFILLAWIERVHVQIDEKFSLSPESLSLSREKRCNYQCVRNENNQPMDGTCSYSEDYRLQYTVVLYPGITTVKW